MSFFTGPAQKALSMELVPPNREKVLTSLNMAKIPTKKVKVQVRVCQTFTLCLNLTEKMEVSDLEFHFFGKDIAIFCEL